MPMTTFRRERCPDRLECDCGRRRGPGIVVTSDRTGVHAVQWFCMWCWLKKIFLLGKESDLAAVTRPLPSDRVVTPPPVARESPSVPYRPHVSPVLCVICTKVGHLTQMRGLRSLPAGWFFHPTREGLVVCSIPCAHEVARQGATLS
jgi:hypothetical protein